MVCRSVLWMSVAFGLVSATVACSGPDPGVVTFSDGTGTTSNEGSGAGGGGGGKGNGGGKGSNGTSSGPTNSTTGTGNTVFASDLYPAVKGSCGTCHQAGTGGAPVFFGADAAASYPLFKARNYHRANSVFLTKGAHTGPALTEAQKASVNKWVSAEAAGGPDGG